MPFFIDIETKRGWKLTLTSPSCDAVEKTTRPGAKSFATQESKSSPVAEDVYPKFSRRSLGPYDIIEEACAEPSSTTPPPSRSRSFRKTFHWFRVHFSRLSRSDSSCPAYNDEVETLPPYHHHHCSELLSSEIQELPGETPEMFGQEMPHELEVRYPRPFNNEDCDMNTAVSPYFSFHLAETGKWNHVDMVHQHQRGPTPLTIPNHPPNMIAQLYAVPAMSMEGSSTRSSPVSPYTPGRDNNYEAQDQYDPGFMNGTVSPHEAALPGTGVYAADGYNFHGWQGYPPVSNIPCPVVPGLPETHSPSPITGMYPRETTDFPCAPDSYQEHSQEPIPSQRPSITPEEPHHGLDDPRLGTWEKIGSLWYRRRTHDERVEQTSDNDHLPDQQVLNELQQALYHVDNSQHQSLPQETSATIMQTAPYPPVSCLNCGQKFNGRYRKGNLKRHVDTKHNTLKPTVGMTCRVCKQGFKRRDAKRKHEWNKHRLFDARPTTRQPK